MIQPRRPVRIVFVGRNNDIRTQIAEGFARRRFDPAELSFRSAGTAPTRLSPWAVLVMDEVGIDISGQRATALDSILASNVDKVVLLEQDLKLPARFHGVRRVEWRISELSNAAISADAMLRRSRAVRDQIEPLVLALGRRLASPSARFHLQ